MPVPGHWTALWQAHASFGAHRRIVEGSGAVLLAALLNQRIAGTSGKTVAALLTGRNVSTERLKALLSSVLNLKLAER